ncbi:MAG: hypothetical protein GY953_53000 [bacterium]|nr:hypothetical protein [bacterium]
MPVTMICPHLSCGQTIVAPDGARGKVLRCAHCKQTFLVPAETREAPEDGVNQKENHPNKR